jgi:hypothetical protein
MRLLLLKLLDYETLSILYFIHVIQIEKLNIFKDYIIIVSTKKYKVYSYC